MKPTVIALANQKGGVGKTTSAISLAACVAEQGHRVLLVDLDPQCNATSGLGIVQSPGASVYGALLGDDHLPDRVRETAVENLDIVPSELDLAGAEVDVARAERYLHRFSDALKPIRDEGRHEFVFVDCPPSLGILTMNGLAAADSVLVPMQCEYYALEGLTVITRLIDQVRDSGANPDLKLQGILMTMFDGRTNLSAQVVEEVRRYFGDTVYETVIPRNVRLSEAPSHGVPVTHYDAASAGAKAYRKFAAEFLVRAKAEVQQAGPEKLAEAAVAPEEPADEESSQESHEEAPQSGSENQPPADVPDDAGASDRS